ncbi:MAG TPA: NAD(P)H-dependent glycerol-3-phosphate dehydrogenase [Porticoccaceae bacterium]|nr:NAD(P)H-dependent glycerol-3-phosphate dehydrogenase [Porticoccaceae bacterium]
MPDSTRPKLQQQRVTVLGGGSFGTAIANMIAGNGHSTTLWMRNAERARQCRQQRENSTYLPGYRLDQSLLFSTDLKSALENADVVFFSVPSKAFRNLARDAAPFLRPGTSVISTAKGIEGETFKRMSEILEEELTQPRVGVISGPNLALEVVRGELTASVIASADARLCQQVQELLSTETFRVYANEDVTGVELAGALKNIYAIAAGIASALGFGQNTMALLVTRSLAEMSRFAGQLGAQPMTYIGLSGVGDLFVTCTSPLSRNFRIGLALGKGRSLEEALADVGQTAEGVNTTRIIKQKAEALDIYMPLANALHEVLFEEATISQAIRKMMLAAQTDDVEFFRPEDAV